MSTANPAAAGLAIFGISESACEIRPASDGYINDTFIVSIDREPKYVLQRLSTAVFGDGVGLMQNLELVLPFLKAGDYQELELIPTSKGRNWEPDTQGQAWRMYRFIKDSHTLPTATTAEVAYEAGRIIGRFHQLVAPLDPADLFITLPRFHDLNWRAEQLETAIGSGISDRISLAEPWIALSRTLIKTCLAISWADLPVRVCHNDTKLSNILFSSKADEALCLIDLDTLMPGYFLYDVGDAVRTLTNPLPEDYQNWEHISIQADLFRPFVGGIKASGLQLSQSEIETLYIGPILLPLLHGIRALADFLMGDVYYKIAYHDQNLVRARSLLQVAKLTADRKEELQKICKEVLG